MTPNERSKHRRGAPPAARAFSHTRGAQRVSRIRMSETEWPPVPISPPPRQMYEKGRLRIDFDAYEVFVDNRQVFPFLREFELLRFFVRFPNHVFDRGEILSSVWGDDVDVDPRTIDVHVRRLRTWIERDASQPELIVTVRGVGYKFDERALARPAIDASGPLPTAAGGRTG